MARRVAQALIVLTVSCALAGCGGDDEEGTSPDDAPRDATSADFCAAWAGQGDEGLDEDAPLEDQAAAVAEVYRRDATAAQETGTPADIPDDARDGFEILVEAALGLTETTVRESFEAGKVDPIEHVLEGDDATAVEVFSTWADDYCD